MKYNFLRYVLLMLSLLPLAASCSFIEEEYVTDVALDDVKDLNSLEFALNGVYSRLQGCYAPNLLAMGELGTDISCTTKTNPNALPIDSYTLNPSTPACETYWRNHFILVRDANIVMDKADELFDAGIIEERDALRIKAEAAFLRAFAYYRLMMAYGELPLIDKRIETIGREEFLYARASINEVFHFIEKDLQYAIDTEMLGNKVGGRANIWAAKGLLAKLYLYVGTSKLRNSAGTPEGGKRADNGEPVPGSIKEIIPGYSAVEESCETLFADAKSLLEDVIANGKFGLTESYHDPFIPAKKNTNVESIWEIQFAAISGYGSSWSKLFGLNTGTNQQNFSAVGGQNVLKPTPGFYKMFKFGDSRRDINVAHTKVVYFDDKSLQSTTDMFSQAYNEKITNPHNNQPVQVGFSSNLENIFLPEILQRSYLQTALSLQLGTWKYGWGSSPDPSQWMTESMAYALSDCPNNVVVLRYADILLMYAECDMLLNGASPADPSSASASQLAVDYVNMVVTRAMAGLDPVANEEEWRLKFEADVATTKEAYEKAKADYEKTPNNNSKFKTYYTSELNYRNAVYKLENVADICIKPYTVETLTYEALIDERGKEFFGEFQRWFDLQRLGWLEYKTYQRKINWESFPLPDIQVPKHYLFPIPLMETDLSMNEDFKKNNPGY